MSSVFRAALLGIGILALLSWAAFATRHFFPGVLGHADAREFLLLPSVVVFALLSWAMFSGTSRR